MGILGMFVGVLGLSWSSGACGAVTCARWGLCSGLVGRFAVFGRVVDEDKCVRCLKCEAVCPLDAVA